MKYNFFLVPILSISIAFSTVISEENIVGNSEVKIGLQGGDSFQFSFINKNLFESVANNEFSIFDSTISEAGLFYGSRVEGVGEIVNNRFVGRNIMAGMSLLAIRLHTLNAETAFKIEGNILDLYDSKLSAEGTFSIIGAASLDVGAPKSTSLQNQTHQYLVLNNVANLTNVSAVDIRSKRKVDNIYGGYLSVQTFKDFSEEDVAGQYQLTMKDNQLNISNSSEHLVTTEAIAAAQLEINETSPTQNSKFEVDLSSNKLMLNGGNYKDSAYISAALVKIDETDKSLALAKAYTLKLTNNEVSLHGEIIGMDNAELGGSLVWAESKKMLTQVEGRITGDSDFFTGNTLNFHARPIKVKSVKNFEFYNYHLNSDDFDQEASIVMIEAKTANIDRAQFHVESIAPGKDLLVDDKITLLYASNGLEGNFILDKPTLKKVTQGFSFNYTLEISQEDNKIIATVMGDKEGPNPEQSKTLNPRLKSLLDGRLASLTTVNLAQDIISEHIHSTQYKQGDILEPFVILQGGHSQYSAGSTVKMDHFNAALGLNYKDDGKIFGAFLEAGTGNFKTNHYQADYGDVKAKGRTHYMGVGLLGRYQWNNSYVDGSLRIGRVSTRYNSQDIAGFDNSASYTSKVTYFAGHVGLGHSFDLKSDVQLGLSAKYLWARLGKDSLELGSDPMDFDRLKSDRLRTMANIEINVPNSSLVYGAGIGYEYELSGKAQGTTHKSYDILSPSIKGGTGILEFGVKGKPTASRNLVLEAKVQGFTGKRKGATASVHLQYQF